MTLRDQLDQIERLEKCLKRPSRFPRNDDGTTVEERDYEAAIADWFHRGGRELAEDGMRLIWFLSRRDSTDGIVKMMLRQIEGDYPSMDEWRTAIDAARAKEEK